MEKERLMAEARKVLDKAYAPYSGYHVAAALLAADGKIYCGVNVENASYGATLCAERNALAAAVADGTRVFNAMAIISDGEEPAYPCGICRQALSEFSQDMPIYIGSTQHEDILETSLDVLLPYQFSLHHVE